MKTSSIFLLLSISLLSPLAMSASRNLCDDLIDSGATPDQIKKCQDKFGESDYSKSKALSDSTKKAADAKKSAETASKNDNVEIKVFTSADLAEAGFGKPFFAIRGDYRHNRYTEKRITEGDALCKYLGFEKVIKSIVSPEIMPGDANNKGLIVDTNFLGKAKSEPELYKDSDEMFTVRKYNEISCAKRKDKSLDTSNEILKLVTEDLIVLNGSINSQSGKKDSDVNDAGRTTKEGGSNYGYKIPEWAREQVPAKNK